MFLEKRVYQGSSGSVYPLPFVDRIAEQPVEHAWDAIHLENEFVYILILPEIGGRIHRFLDKTNGYDVIYYQPVIKPALVGLAGPWISGGIEFNWPQHHRPSTFMPTIVEIEHEPDGSITVWLAEHDPMARMKGMHGVRLRPGRTVLELRARVFNRTQDTQTFLWWANVATEVHERYQSFFPTDATFVADHAKRAMSTFPRCSGHYYGVDYARRAREGVPNEDQPAQFVPPGDYPANDLSWYANIPVPTSYMCMGTGEDYFGGYDHAVNAGIIHLADHHISPGKKQWTWGNHEFGYAWDRNLTEPNAVGVYRPYIELMAGVYTDNQPDFAFLQPGETKAWTQYWYPIRSIGPADQANIDAAVSLRFRDDRIRVGVSVTNRFHACRVVLSHRLDNRIFIDQTVDLSPTAPWVMTESIPDDVPLEQLSLTVTQPGGREIIRHTPKVAPPPPTPAKLAELAATEPKAPQDITSADELFFTGVHLEQYRHATRHPEPYWREALRRDPGDARCNLALGRWHLRRGEWPQAEHHLRASIARQTFRNPNPADGEAHYRLGCTLRWQGQVDEAETVLAKATWNQAWIVAAKLALAEMACERKNWSAAFDYLDACLRLDADHLQVHALRIMVLRKLQLTEAAETALANALSLDKTDPWLRDLAGLEWIGDTQMRLDLVHDLARAGFLTEALKLLQAAAPEPHSGTAPLVGYTRGWLLERLGRHTEAKAERCKAALVAFEYCFPARLEEILILEAAIAADPDDARPPFYLGHLLYAKRRHHEAIKCWEAAVRLEPGNAVAWRCLGIGYLNILNKPLKARTAFERAVAAAPDDARLLYERDQLWKRLGVAPTKRLQTLKTRPDLVARRDDLTLELCALLNQNDQPETARALLQARKFQPWEGGEGVALGQHTRTHLKLGHQAMKRGDCHAALELFEHALSAPQNLGEARHFLANRSDLLFWIGEARYAVGDKTGARKVWQAAATFRGDFQDMSVRAFSELTYFSALSWKRLGDEQAARNLLYDLLDYARKLEKRSAKIDYFATSLPTLLIFNDDLQARQTTNARFLQAQAWMGLGKKKKASTLLQEVLQRDPTHAMAADLLSEL